MQHSTKDSSQLIINNGKPNHTTNTVMDISSTRHKKQACGQYTACVVNIVAVLFICCSITDFIGYYLDDIPVIIWIARALVRLSYLVIWILSLVRQKDNLQSLRISKDTMQSHQTNMILIFAGLIYCSVLTCLILMDYKFADGISGIIHTISVIFIAAHIVGGLKWAKISPSSDYSVFSANWWSCIFCINGFFLAMAWTVITPWTNKQDFIDNSHELQDRAGEFVHVLVMYGCRPALTIIAFRCIEQIIHQLGHGPHAAHHKDEYVLLDINATKYHTIAFKPLTAMEVLILAPFVLCAVVFDMMTLTEARTSTVSRGGLMTGFIMYMLMNIWAIIVVLGIGINITIKSVIKKHLALIISAVGLIIELIGTIGVYAENGIWEIWLNVFMYIAFVILQCVSVILFNEKKFNIKCDTLFIILYGKAMVILHVLLLLRAFLGEGAHLERTMHSMDDDELNVFSALEFIFFFWRIEYHLAVIERINFD